MLIVLAACLLGQWFVAQLPLWGLGVAYGLRLQHPDQAQTPVDPRDRQFGIRELLIFTTIIAVILGIGRVVVASLPRSILGDEEAGIFVFLAVAAVLFALPLLVAGLLPRYAGLAVAIGLAVIAIASSAWQSYLARIPTNGSPWPAACQRTSPKSSASSRLKFLTCCEQYEA